MTPMTLIALLRRYLSLWKTLLPGVLFLGWQVSCAGKAGSNAVALGEPGSKPKTAREAAVKDPCSLLLAIRKRVENVNDNPPLPWVVSVKVECCEEPTGKGARRPAVMTIEPSGPEVIGWDVACPDGPGGPLHGQSKTEEFDYISLYEKSETTIAFQITPAYVEFDVNGKEAKASTQGCPDFTGEARFAARRGARCRPGERRCR